MSDTNEPQPPPKGQLLVYQAEDGRMKIDVRLENETAWLTQAQMADLFQTTIPNVSMHLRNIFEEGELQPAATIKEFLTVRAEGSRQVSRSVEHYNLDAIISVGYRVKSAVATRFRIWATQKLREFIVKGFVLDESKHFSIPTGLYPSAQGCEGRATLGRHRNISQPQRGCVAGDLIACRWTQPFQGCSLFFRLTQGSSCLATLGFGTESLWDSPATARDIEAKRDAAAAKLKTFLGELGYE